MGQTGGSHGKKYTVFMDQAEGTTIRPANPAAGDQILLVERPLYNDAQKGAKVGSLTARLTVMKRDPNGVLFVLGNADHHLDKGPNQGMVSVQGSWRFDNPNPVFAIIGGTRKWRAARGTVTLQDVSDDDPNTPQPEPEIESLTYKWT